MPVTSQIIKPTFSTSYQQGSTSQWQLLSFFLAFTSPSPPPALSSYFLLIYQKWWSDCRVILHRFPPVLHYMYTKHLLHHTGCFLWCPSFSPWLSTETMTHMLTCILGVVKYWCQTCCSRGLVTILWLGFFLVMVREVLIMNQHITLVQAPSASYLNVLSMLK